MVLLCYIGSFSVISLLLDTSINVTMLRGLIFLLLLLFLIKPYVVDFYLLLVIFSFCLSSVR